MNTLLAIPVPTASKKALAFWGNPGQYDAIPAMKISRISRAESNTDNDEGAPL